MIHKFLNAHNTYEDPVLTMIFKSEFRRRLSGVPRAHFVCNKTAEYTFDKFNCSFILLPIFVHHRRWVYSQCKLRITKHCFFLLNLPKYFISLNESLRFKTSYFTFAPKMSLHRVPRKSRVSHKPRTDINGLKTTGLGHTKAT